MLLAEGGRRLPGYRYLGVDCCGFLLRHWKKVIPRQQNRNAKAAGGWNCLTGARPVIRVAVDRKDEARDKVYNAAVERAGAGTG